MFRKLLCSAVATAALVTGTSGQAHDRFGFGGGFGGGYQVYDPNPIRIQPYPYPIRQPYPPSYGYGFRQPGFSFHYSNWGSPRPVYRPFPGYGGYPYPHHHCH